MINKTKRLFIYLALCYFAVTLALFVVYYASASFYFYRVHKSNVLSGIQGQEEVFLYKLLTDLRAVKNLEKAREEYYREVLKKIGAEKLASVATAVEFCADLMRKQEASASHMEGKPPGKAENPESSGRLRDIINSSGKPGFTDELIGLIEKVGGGTGDHIRLRLSGEGAPRDPQPLEYLELANRTLAIENDAGEKRTWTLRSFGRPSPPLSGDGYAAVLHRYEKENPNPMSRLAIFRFGGGAPYYQGKANSMDSTGLESHEKESLDKGLEVFNVQAPASEEVVRDGQPGEEVILKASISDPDLQFTLALTQRVSEQFWRKPFSFFDRNQVVILTFFVLAWVVFPLIAYIAYRFAIKMRFNMTLDLDGERNEELLPGENAEEELAAHQPLTVPTAAAPPPDEKPAPQAMAAIMAGPSPAKNAATLFEEFRSKDISEIRTNNIRKSKGMFNASRDLNDRANVDYLEGVQSDVLKSLLKKLREH